MDTKTYFLEYFAEFGICSGHADLHLSDYNFHKVRKIKPLSPLRWVRLENGLLAPGQGSGTLILGIDLRFKVTYAWGGRHKRIGNERASYTTRIEGDIASLKVIRDVIIKDEHGSLTYDVPFRESVAKVNEKTDGPVVRGPSSYRKHLLYLRAESKRLPLKLSPWNINKMVEEFTKKWRDPKAVVTFPHVMARIETDML